MTAPRVSRAAFGRMPDSAQVDGYTIRNATGTSLRVITYGAIITELRTADRNGRFDDVVLGFDDLAGYLKDTPYFGAIVGRYANRIALGRFTLDGRTHQVPSTTARTRCTAERAAATRLFGPRRRSRTTPPPVSRSSRESRRRHGISRRVDVSVTYTLNDRNESWSNIWRRRTSDAS